MTKALLSLFAALTAVASSTAEIQIGAVELSRLDGSRLTMQNYAEHRATVVLFLSSRSSDTDSARDKIRELNRRRCTSHVRPMTAKPGADPWCWNQTRASTPTPRFYRPATEKYT